MFARLNQHTAARPGLPPPVYSPRLPAAAATAVTATDPHQEKVATAARRRRRRKKKKKKTKMMKSGARTADWYPGSRAQRCASTQPEQSSAGVAIAHRPSTSSSAGRSARRARRTAGPRTKRLQVAVPNSNVSSSPPPTPLSPPEPSISRNHIPERALNSKYVRMHMAKMKKFDISQEEIDSIVDGLSRKDNDAGSLAATLAAKIKAINLTTSMRSIERGQEEHDAHEVLQMKRRTAQSRRLVRALGAVDEEADFTCHDKTAALLQSRMVMLRRQANQLGVEIREEKNIVQEKERRNKMAIMLAKSQVQTYKPHVRRTIKRLCHGDEHMTRLLLSMGKQCDLLVRLQDSLVRADKRRKQTSWYTPTLRNMIARDRRIYEAEKLDAGRLQESVETVATKLKHFASLQKAMAHASSMGEERLDAVHTELNINREERLEAIRVRLENLLAQRRLKKKLAERERQRVEIKHQAMINAKKVSGVKVADLNSGAGRRISIMGGIPMQDIQQLENRMLGKKIMEQGAFPIWQALQRTILERTSIMAENPTKLVERMFGHAASVASLQKELDLSFTRKDDANKRILQLETDLQVCLQGGEKNGAQNADVLDSNKAGKASEGAGEDAVSASAHASPARTGSSKHWDEERMLKDLADRFKQRRQDVRDDSLSIRAIIEGVERMTKECERMYASLREQKRNAHAQSPSLSPVRAAKTNVLSRRPSTLDFVTILNRMDNVEEKSSADAQQHINMGHGKSLKFVGGGLASEVITGLDSQKIALLRDHIPQLFAFFSGVLTRLNGELLSPPPLASGADATDEATYGFEPAPQVALGDEEGDARGQERTKHVDGEELKERVREPSTIVADEVLEPDATGSEVDSVAAGPGTKPLMMAKLELSEATELMLSPHNVRVQSALSAKEITVGERRQQTTVLRTRVLRESRVASELRPANRLLRAIHASLQAEQELLVSGVDPNLGNTQHMHNVASLRQEDAEGHVTIQTTQHIAFEQDDCRDSEDEDVVGQRAAVKLLSSPKKRPSADLDGAEAGGSGAPEATSQTKTKKDEKKTKGGNKS
jgi:hypothetical protein